MRNSKIEWTTHTHNPWIGCTKVSPGCERCYAMNTCDTRHQWVKWGPNGVRREVRTTIRHPYRWQREVLKTGTRARVFCASLGDVFDDHPSIQQEWRDRLWKTIRETPLLDWMLLTKRPENMRRFLPDDWGKGYPNVCLMVTVENQALAAKRIPILLKTPAVRRALSVEPLIGEVDLSPWIKQLDWVIAGGETLSDPRPMNPNWVRRIRDLCRANKVPFLFKQWGWWTPEVLPGRRQHEFTDGEVVYYRGNAKRNGNHLDGRQHLAIPFRELVSARDRKLSELALARQRDKVA